MEYITASYYDEIKKQRIKEHSNEVEGSKLLVYPIVTRCRMARDTRAKRCDVHVTRARTSTGPLSASGY